MTTKWIAPRRAARLLDVSVETLTAWAKSSKLPPYAIVVLPSGQRRYDVAKIEAAMRPQVARP
jgi:predicted site-specific integrase-resolvase